MKLTATCDQVTANKETSMARFVIENPVIKPEPGKPAQRTAKTVITVMFADPEKAFEFRTKTDYDIQLSAKK